MTQLGTPLRRMLGRPDERGQPFSWRFTTPMFLGSALNPINSSLIATALVPIASGVRRIGRSDRGIGVGVVLGERDRPAHVWKAG